LSENASSPFFVIGSGRCGTSLLGRMLDCHPRLAVPFETVIIHTFWNMEAVYAPLTDPANRRRLVADILAYPPVQDVRPPMSMPESLAEIRRFDMGGVVDGVLTAWAKGQGKSRWGETTPSNALHFATLNSWFPQAKLLHLIRDGRDVARSFVDARVGPKTLFTAAKRWERFVLLCRAIGASLPAERYLELRYETLLDAPEATMRQVCAFLEEPYDPAMLRFVERPVYYPTDPTNMRNLNRDLITTNKFKWRATMAADEVAMVEAAVGPTLRVLGYDTVGPSRRVGKLETFYRERIEPLPHRALSVSRNRRGRIEAQAKIALMAKRWRAMLFAH
jgi:hypothetical protein